MNKELWRYEIIEDADGRLNGYLRRGSEKVFVGYTKNKTESKLGWLRDGLVEERNKRNAALLSDVVQEAQEEKIVKARWEFHKSVSGDMVYFWLVRDREIERFAFCPAYAEGSDFGKAARAEAERRNAEIDAPEAPKVEPAVNWRDDAFRQRDEALRERDDARAQLLKLNELFDGHSVVDYVAIQARAKELEAEKAVVEARWDGIVKYWMTKSMRLSSDLDAARRTIRSLMDEKRLAYRRAGE